MVSVAKIARRTFLIGSAAVAGGIAIGYYWYNNLYPNPLKDNLGDGEAALTPYVLITTDGVTLITPRAEMGQGVQSTLAALIAEELDVGWDEIKFDHGPSDKAYYNAAVLSGGSGYPGYDESDEAETARARMEIPARLFGVHITGGSSSMRDGFVKMRKAGAAARQVLLKAAARKLDVSISNLSTDNGSVIAPDGTRLAYTELAPLAADISPPSDPDLKPASQWRYVGKSMPRLDIPDKCTGSAMFASDVKVEGLLFATVKRNPYRTGMNSFDASQARSMTGVVDVVDVGDGVAVVATNTWYANRALNTVLFDWEPPDYPTTTDGHFARLNEALAGELDIQPINDEGIDGFLDQSAKVFELNYRVPYLAHQTMEPMSATAWMRDGKIDVWYGAQSPTRGRTLVAEATGLKEEDVALHVTYLGGGFGRRAENDVPVIAAKIAKAVEGKPVRLLWTREEDMAQDYYRPMAAAQIRAAMDGEKLAAMDVKAGTTGSVLNDQFIQRGGLPMGDTPDATIVDGLADQPFDIKYQKVTGYRTPTLLPIHSWRAVGASQNGFFSGTAIDELAYAEGKDPLAFILNLLTDEPSKKVVEEVGRLSGWGRRLPTGHARGIAFFHSFGLPVAEVVEIAQQPDGIRILKAFAAVDVGIALDPRNIEAQVMSGIIFGLSAAISGELTIEDGRVQQLNFHQQDLMRMYQAPSVEVTVLENTRAVKGIGEPGLPPAAPALGNAIFALTGQRLRELPFGKFVEFA